MNNKDHILIVDDNLNNIKVIGMILRKNYEISVVQSGMQALETMEGGLPDLILMDVMMPGGLNGYETCSRLKDNPRTRDIPVIFITALSSVEDKVKGFDCGGVDYITKPFQSAEVLARVSTHLFIRKLQTQLEENNRKLEERQSKLEMQNEELLSQKKELELLYNNLAKAQHQLLQSEKMVAIGTMSAGIAHEMNNSLQYICTNLRFIDDGIQSIFSSLDDMNIKLSVEESFLVEEVPQAFKESAEGFTKLQNIVASMRGYAEDYSKIKIEIDIIKVINDAILLCKNKLEDYIQITTDFAKGNYGVSGIKAEIIQIFINLILNAIEAIIFSNKKSGEIKIKTEVKENMISINISDNGPGIQEDIRGKIFDPFFTTKNAEGHIGLGLASVYNIVVEKYHGSINFLTEIDKGTTFNIKLPGNS